MRYTVVESFATPLRRFPAGIEVDAADIDGPVPVERWVEMGRLKPVEEPAVTSAPADKEPAAVDAASEPVEPRRSRRS